MIQRETDHAARQQYARRVARAIARGDRQLADDLEQDAMMVALTSEPDHPQLWRGWMRAIVRNTLRYDRFRDAQRPLHTEIPDDFDAPAIARDQEPDQAVADVELTGRLGQLMDALPDTYRDVVRMRVIEELPPAVVAERLGLTPETVRTRHRRGLALLREDAERTLGRDSLPAWRGWIGMLLGGGSARPAWKLAGAILLVAVPLTLVARALLSPPDSEEPATLVNVALAPVSARESLVETLDGRTAAPVDSGTAALAPDPSAAPLAAAADSATSTLPITVEVIDTSGKPVEEAEVYLQHGLGGRVELAGTTDEMGRLGIEVPKADSWLAARHLPGASSRAFLVDQPIVRAAGGEIQLTLNQLDVMWRGIEIDDELKAAGVTIHGARTHPKVMTVYRLGEGIIGVSSWLPAWQDGDRYGVTEPNSIMFQARTASGDLLWSSDLHRRERPLPETLIAAPTVRVEGRLVSESGRAVPGERIEAQLAGRGWAPIASAITDRDGRFALESCPRTPLIIAGRGGHLLRLDGLGGRAAAATTSKTVDAGTLVHHECAPTFTLIDLDRPWEAVALAKPRPGVPELLRPIGGVVLARQGLQPGEERLTFEKPPFGRVGPMLFRSVDDGSPCALLEPEPSDGWVPHMRSISLRSCAAGYCEAHIDISRLPVTARWVESRTGLAMAALVDDTTGRVHSEPLPAGTWALHLLDHFGVQQASDEKDLLPGATVDFGILRDRSGRIRVALPVEDDPEERKLGLLRVTSHCGRASKRTFFPPGEKLPAFVELDLPPLEYSVTLLIDDLPYIASCEVRAGGVQDVAVSSEEFLVRLSGITAMLKQDPGLTLRLLDKDGVPQRTVSGMTENLLASGEIIAALPRLEGGKVAVESGSGARLKTEPVQVDVLGFQRVRL